MKIDQIAYYCNFEYAEKNIKNTFGLLDGWINDTVECTNRIYPEIGRPYTSEAIGELQFNYVLGIELEILRYTEGSSWHNHLPNNIALKGNLLQFQSHVGIHLDDREDFPDEENMHELKWRLVQETTTHKHSNPYLIEKKRTYRYKIYESVPGTYLKYIKRIEAK